MLVRRLGQRLLLNTKIVMNSHGPQKPYDWRNDPSQNWEIDPNPRMIGVKKATEYVFPHHQEAQTWTFSHPENYDQKNLYTNCIQHKNTGPLTNSLQVPHTDFDSDIPHEYDYESQDLDFQAQSFESQHFRKKGPLFIWVIVGTTPLWFFASELFLQQWPDEDNWRYQRPPPLNYTDDQITPDQQVYELFHSKQYNELWDAGILVEPFFEIKDGKKIYSKYAGVNKPMDII